MTGEVYIERDVWAAMKGRKGGGDGGDEWMEGEARGWGCISMQDAVCRQVDPSCRLNLQPHQPQENIGHRNQGAAGGAERVIL